jgi:hypothetical protein
MKVFRQVAAYRQLYPEVVVDISGDTERLAGAPRIPGIIR